LHSPSQYFPRALVAAEEEEVAGHFPQERGAQSPIESSNACGEDGLKSEVSGKSEDSRNGDWHVRTGLSIYT